MSTNYRAWSRRFGVFLSAWLGVAGLSAQELPWHLGAVDATVAAPAAINTAAIKPGANEVVVAVIDSGIFPSHPSLAGRVLPGYDMVSGNLNDRGARSTNFSPDNVTGRCAQFVGASAGRTHGTEIASLIAGNGQDGVLGVNPEAKILPIRLFSGCGMSRSDLMDALAWAAGFAVDGVARNPNPARVINLSFSGGRAVCDPDLQALLDRIAKKNIFVVAAVGNSFQKQLAEPANCSGVISVGALDAQNNIEDYSALDARTVIYAPGGGSRIFGPDAWRVNKLKVASFQTDLKGNDLPMTAYRGVGTSYAAPLVSGFVSLWLSYRPELTPADFFANIDKFTRSVNPSDKCKACLPRGLALGQNGFAGLADTQTGVALLGTNMRHQN
jgi:serine protease